MTVPRPLSREERPTEHDLPYSDGVPLDSQREVLQLEILRTPLVFAWADRQDFLVGTNMFLYYSLEQVRNEEFMGPDVFVALNVPRREHKSWVMWQEGKGPDVVIELLSETTARHEGGTGRRFRFGRGPLRLGTRRAGAPARRGGGGIGAPPTRRLTGATPPG